VTSQTSIDNGVLKGPTSNNVGILEPTSFRQLTMGFGGLTSFLAFYLKRLPSVIFYVGCWLFIGLTLKWWR